MAVEDANLSHVLYTFVLPLVIAVLFLTVVIKNGSSWSSRYFAYYYTNYALPALDKLLAPHKQELFADIGDVVSNDSEMRNKGLIRILEIGIGPGANLIYYPKNCRIVGYDPNPYFRSALFRRCEDISDIKLERLVVAGAESLVDTADSSVDVVVSTLVLCTVENMDLVLKEVFRVLAPGGKFYILEHTIAPVGNFYRKVHVLLNPVWKLMFAGCNLNRDIEAAVRRVGYSQVKIKRFQINEGGMINILLSSVIAATALK